jgi:VanZ family protein
LIREIKYLSSSPLRPITVALVTIETLVAIFYITVFHQPGRSDAITNIIVDGVTLVIGAIWLIFVLPAIVLTVRDTRPELALGLSLGAILAFFASFLLL